MRVPIGLLVAAAAAVSSNSWALTPEAQGVAYLLSQQSPIDGSFGGSTGEDPVVATSEAVLALQKEGGESAAVERAQAYLAFATVTTDDQALRRAAALANGPYADLAGLSLYLPDINSTSPVNVGVPFGPGFAGGLGSPSLIETCLAIQAAVPAGSDPTIANGYEAAADALLAQQSPQFGWHLVDENDDASTTGLVAETLAPFRFFVEVPGQLNAGLNALLATQNGAGVFGDGAAPVLDTAHALLAMSGVATGSGAPDVSGAAANAVAYLDSDQLGDGSWEEKVYSTALVLRALSGQRPDWAVSLDENGNPYLALSNPSPLSGGSETATLIVLNRSPVAAPSTTVGLTATATGGAVTSLGSFPLAGLDPGSTATVSMAFSTVGLSGSYTLTAVVNPGFTSPETNYQNNTATAVMTVVHAVDLAIADTDITFQLMGGNQLQVSATVHSVGDAITTPFPVSFYKGNPTNQGVPLGTVTIPSLGSGVATTVTELVSTVGLNGTTPFFVQVDPGNVVGEVNLTNNLAFRYYTLGSGAVTDLAISPSDLVLTPAQPLNGQDGQLVVTVHNLSANDALQVPVQVSLAGSQYQALSNIPIVPANGSATVGFSLFFQGGAQYVMVVVDPYDELNDPNRGNNTAEVAAEVGNPAYAFTLASVSSQGSNPVTLFASVLSKSAVAGTTSVRFYLGDPMQGPAQVLGELPLSFPDSNGSNSAGSVSLPGVILTEPCLVTACVNPDRSLPEQNYFDDCLTQTFPATPSNESQLEVLSNELQFAPLGPNVGEAVTATIPVHNLSPNPATGVARLWAGYPTDLNASLLGEQPFTVAANTNRALSFSFVRPPGTGDVSVTLNDVIPTNGQPPQSGVATSNVFVAGQINTGRPLENNSNPVVGDLLGTGHPALVFAETEFINGVADAHLTAGTFDPVHGYVELWSVVVDTNDAVWAPPVIEDLDSDGLPEAIVQTSGTISTAVNHWYTDTVTVLEPDGLPKWIWSNPDSGIQQDCNQSQFGPGLGDVNGDGIADVVINDGLQVVALNGSDGAVLWRVPLVAGELGSCPEIVVADVYGDGGHEVTIGQFSNGARQYSSTGQLLWAGGGAEGQAPIAFGLVDLDGDGIPELVYTPQEGPTVALDATTGQFKYEGPFGGWPSGFASADVRQNGLTYPTTSNNASTSIVGAMQPSLQPLWENDLDGATLLSGFIGPSLVTYADLLGLGRPQAIVRPTTAALIIVDSRSGTNLQFADLNAESQLISPNVVADVFGNGGGAIVTGNSYGGPGSQTTYSNIGLPPSNFVVFSSVHWKQQSKVWNQVPFIAQEVDEHLRPTGNYQPWVTHNTWNDTFLTTPATLLADLIIADGGIASSPTSPASGSSASLTVTVQNIGGLAAINPAVSVYDGNPDAGGTLIGSGVVAATLGPVSVGDGGVLLPSSGTVTLPWTPYPDGEHLIYAIVNANQSIPESGYENNEASVQVVVSIGTQLSDVAALSLTASPQGAVAGSSVTLTVNLTNEGAVDTGPFSVSFYDGIPNAGGTNVIAIAASPDLAAGANEQLTATWLATVGSHELFVVADPAHVTQDSNLGNDTASTTLTVVAENAPDLAILASAFTVAPNPVSDGTPATLTATVVNLGSDVQSTAVDFYNGNPADGGILLGRVPLVGLIQPGGTVTASYSLPTLGLSGSYTLFAYAEPDPTLGDSNLANNTASATLTVVSPQLTLTASTDQGSYPANTAVVGTASVVNAETTGRTLAINAWIERSTGYPVVTLATHAPLIVPASGSASLPTSWNTGSTPSGNYQFHAQVSEGGVILANAVAPFAIVAGTQLLARLTTDQITYVPGESALLSQLIINQGPNTATGPLTSVLTVSSGSTVLLQTTRTLASLSVGESTSATDLFAISAMLAPGTYPCALQVFNPGQALLASATATLTVVASSPSQALVASISATPPQFTPGQEVTFTVPLTNHGNTSVSSTVNVIVVPLTSLTEEVSLSEPLTLATGASQTLTYTWTAPSNEPLGGKLALVQVNGVTLARTMVTAVSTPPYTIPPSVTITGVSAGEYVPGPVTPVITITTPVAYTATITLDGQPFTSGSSVSAQGVHALVVNAVDVYGNATMVTVVFTVDTTPPVLTLAGVTNGEVTNAASVTPTFSATDNLTPTSQIDLTATLNGVPFTSGAPVSAEGTYTLIVTATDLAGNATTQTVTFALDRTPPTFTVTGVTNGESTSSNVTITFSEVDAYPGPMSATLDGQPFTSGSTVTAEGVHTLVLTAIDQAGNGSTESITFTIDKTPPVITISGVTNGELTAQVPLTPVFSATDNLTPTAQIGLAATLNGLPFTSGTVISANGSYTLVVTATDLANNSSADAVTFVIDTTPPVITLGGFVSGELVNTPVTPTYSASDPYLSSVSATLNGLPFASGTPVTANGSYTLVVTATNSLGTSATATGTFRIDTTPPTLIVSGVTNGEQTNHAVTITFSQSDAYPGTTTATLNGAPFTSGSSVASQGNYTLVVKATDQAGNTSQQTLTFTLDFTPPVLTVAGVANGGLYGTAVTPTATATDNFTPANQIAIAATLNGAPFTLGTAISANGTDTLVVTATDLAGNVATATDTFTIDTTPPTITLTGVTNGEVTNQSVTPVITVSDPHPGTQTITLNGAPFTSGTAVTAPGTYTLVVSATNALGVSAGPVTVEFTIDITPPVITITGVTNGATYTTSVTPVVTVSDAHPNPSQTVITLNGSPFVSGTTVAASGSYTLTVSAKDLAGNTATAAVTFTLKTQVLTLGATGAGPPRILVGYECSQGSGCWGNGVQGGGWGCGTWWGHDPGGGDGEGNPGGDRGGDHGPGCPGPAVVLEAALAADGYAFDVAVSATDFLNLLRENRYAGYVLAEPETPLDGELGQELGEHVYQGTGLLIVQNAGSCDPALSQLAEVTVQGDLQNVSSIQILGTLADAGPLPVAGPVAELNPQSSYVQVVATATPWHWGSSAVATVTPNGSGQVVFLGFDPEQANSPRMVQVVAGALRLIASGPVLDSVPLAVGDLLATVDDLSATSESIQLVATLPTGATELFIDPTATLTHPPTWLAVLPPATPTEFELGLRWPDSAGTDEVSFQLDTQQGSTDVPYATAEVSYDAPYSGAQLIANAIAVIDALPVPNPCRNGRSQAVQAIQGLSPATHLWEAESNVDAVLGALGDLEQLQFQGVMITPARAALEDLLRYEENAYSSLRGWP